MIIIIIIIVFDFFSIITHAYFSSPLDNEIAKFEVLDALTITDSFLPGTIPSGVTQLDFLGSLSLSNNNLTGNSALFGRRLSLNNCCQANRRLSIL
jgi:hypothetical protein